MRVTYSDTVIGSRCRIEADYDEHDREAFVSKVYLQGTDIKGLLWRNHHVELERLRTECLDRCLEDLEIAEGESADNHVKENAIGSAEYSTGRSAQRRIA